MKRQRTQKTSKTMKRQCIALNHTKYDEDKISQLPELILHHILSVLPTKDAGKTSTLSKTWNSTWRSFPALCFHQDSFQKHTRNRPKIKFKEVIEEFIKFVDDSIDYHRGGGYTNLRDFQLQVCSKGFKLEKGSDTNIIIDRWLNYAMDRNVEDLVFEFYGRKKASTEDNVIVDPWYTKFEPWYYTLPLSLFRSQSLKHLELNGCKFIEPSGLISGSGIGLSLRTLRLSQVHIDQNTFESVVSNSCHLLEELCIDQCKGFEAIMITGLSKLEKVDLHLLNINEFQVVAIVAPNLRYISYSGSVDNVESSIRSSYFERIKELALNYVWMEGPSFFKVLSDFSTLERLELNRCGWLTRPDKSNSTIKIPSNVRLLELSICDCVHFTDVELDRSRLRSYKVCTTDMKKGRSITC